MSLYRLRDFFAVTRDEHGTFFSSTECVLNASERRMSTYTEDELLQLRQGAWDLIKLIENEMYARINEDPGCEHESITTADGYGTYCRLCGETLA